MEAFLESDPDVAILDVALGKGASGIDLAHVARDAYPATALLLLTRYPDLSTAQLTPGGLACGIAG
jgi:DNA-binding NarL/FixJ family response regulator